MEIGISVISRGDLARPEHIVPIVQRAEALGFSSAVVSDHIVIPKAMPDNYPYHPEGKFGWEAARDYFEPLGTLAFLAGATRRIRLGVSVLIVSYRNPIATAKQLASVDALSGGRLFLGVGTGWWEDEYKALGIGSHFKERGARTDEYLRIYRNLWTEENPEFKGEFYRYGDLEFSPKPAQKGGIPLWIGGHTPRALRRTVELGDAWHPIGLRPPAGLQPAELAAMRDRLHEMAAKAGRDPAAIGICFRAPVVFSDTREGALTGSADAILEDIGRYAEAGMTHLTCDVVVSDGKQYMEAVERIGAEIVPKV